MFSRLSRECERDGEASSEHSAAINALAVLRIAQLLVVTVATSIAGRAWRS